MLKPVGAPSCWHRLQIIWSQGLTRLDPSGEEGLGRGVLVG